MSEYKGFKNKGLYYRDKAKKRKKEILHKVKNSQQNACFFVKVRNPKTGILYGEKHFFGYEKLFGLLIENKVFYMKDNSIHFIYANKSGFKILETYDNIPDWASTALIDKYKLFYINRVFKNTTNEF